MHIFLEVIRKFRKRYNTIIGIRYSILALLSLLWSFLLFFILYGLIRAGGFPMFYFGLTLRISVALIMLYLFYTGKNKLLDDVKAARMLDRLNGDENETFQNAIELLQEKQGYDEAILDLIYDNANSKSKSQVEHKIDVLNPLQKQISLYGFIGAFIILALNFSFIPTAWQAFYTDKLIKEQHSKVIELSPGNVSLPRHSNLEVKIMNPDLGSDYKFLYRFAKEWRQVDMTDFSYTYNNLENNIEYYVRSKYAVSDTFRVVLMEKPGVKNLTIKYFYPDYTGEKPFTDSLSTGRIKAIENSKIKLTANVISPLEQAMMIFGSGESKVMQESDSLNYTTTFTLTQNDSWHLNLKDRIGQETIDIEREIVLLPDEKPSIQIVYPATDTTLNQTMLQRLQIVASDDFGLDNLMLYFIIEDREPISRNVKKQIHGTLWEDDYVFDLTGLDLFPGNRVEYWLTVDDNKPVPQISESEHRFLRLPSIEEIYKEIESTEKEKRENLEDVLEKSKEMTEEFEEKRRELLKKDELEWDDKQQLEKFLEERNDIKEDVNKVTEQYQDLIDKIQNNEALASETVEKMEKIQQLMQELDSEQMQEAMQEMQKAMEKLDPDVLKKAMKDFKFSMDDFNKKLEMTIDLLESIKKEQQLQKALDIAEQMEELQKQIEEKTGDNTGDNEQLAKEQQKLKEQLEGLKQELQKLQDMLGGDKDKELSEQLKELQEMKEMQELMQDMENSQQQLQQNNRKSAQESQQAASQKIQKMRKMLMDMKSQMSAGGAGEMSEALSVCLRKVLFFSEMHEKQVNIFSDDAFQILQQELAIFEGIGMAVNEMFKAPMLSMFITPKFYYDMNFLEQSYREMFREISENRHHVVKNYLSDITKGINLIAYDLMLTQNSSSSSGGSGMESLMQMMQQMGQQQMAMNMLTQQLMQQLQQGNGGMSSEMRKQIQRLASEEQRLADNLKRALQNNPAAQQQTGSIQKLIEELEQIAKEFKANRLNTDLLKKQERIVSRMLDIQKSINKREFSRKRKAENSEFDDWDTPEEIKYKFKELQNKAMLKKDYKEFPPEYRELIKEYLKILNEKLNEE